MAKITPRLKLTQPEDGDYLSAAVMETNFGILDAQAGATVCTSTTRPTNPYQGQIIYETDTKVTRLWNGTRWAEVAGGETWVDMVYLSGITSGTPGQMRFMLSGPRVFVSGGATMEGRFPAGEYTHIGAVPAGIPLPSLTSRTGAFGQQGRPACFEVHSSGTVTFAAGKSADGTQPLWCAIEMSYFW